MIRLLVRNDRTVARLLAALAAARFVLAGAAFPLFTNIDEQYHFDAVLRQARGTASPRDLRMSDEGVRIIAGSESWEYLNAPVTGPAPDAMVPPWTLPDARRARQIGRELALWNGTLNREAAEPPAYYALAGLWLRVGEALGRHGAGAAYWVRWMNALLAAGLVLAAAAAAKRLYPDRPLVLLGLPLMAAVLHPENWFAINNDAPLACLGAAAFACLCGFPAGGMRAAAGGLLVGAALVTKVTALPLAALLVFPLVPVPRGGRRPSKNVVRAALATLGGFAVPPLLAAGWQRWRGGSLFGLDEKYATLHLNVTLRPWSEVAGHPLWSFEGAAHFLSDLGANLCPGTVFWHRAPVPAGWLAPVALWLALAGLGGAVWIAVGRERSRRDRERRHAVRVALLALAAGIIMLIGFSVAVDFGRNLYTSIEYRYLAAGRYVTGLTVPLLLAVLAGWDRLGGRAIPTAWKLGGLAMFAVCLAVHEIGLLRLAMASGYNWFHLP